MEFDVNHIIELIPELNTAFLQTLYMISVGLLVAVIFGLPIGILIFVTDKGLFLQNRFVNQIVGFIVNMIRSIPFIILLVALIPLTIKLTGSTIGPKAASVPLSVAAIPFFARLVETSLRKIEYGVIEAAIAAGGTPWMIIKDVLLPEAKSGIISGITITVVSLVGTSAMAGVVGGGGIGDLAIRFGYYRYDDTIMITTVVILIVLVQLIQIIGDKIAKAVNK
ncbi:MULTISPECIES: methionine ABC transporter permease [Bacillaceae]|uniref:methionine ABC transporter permease n=1 Tax=Bacillaceae TaxID=186817 RepID=UPI00062147BF|nr:MULTISPECIES: methionine ABC transporter permease [Bacillaceae]KKE78703.1 methionine ABC transporter permease [Bacilli bacterium VT-13-104]PZD83717.1 ABC transporter permease [Bacilli bacterium]MBU8792012.1 ABC transporter permease [Oceanobacillus caeni]MED4473681.1 ABC transporter permease [Oceanobacillus caeni]PZD84906.1 ABC transporter permease [Bacilli bacterium]